MTLTLFKPPFLICNWFMFSVPFLRCGPFYLSFAFWSFSLNNCFIMGFYFLIFDCFTFVCTKPLVWLNPYLVSITQFSFLQFKRLYMLLHFLLYDIIFNDFKLYIYCWCLNKILSSKKNYFNSETLRPSKRLPYFMGKLNLFIEFKINRPVIYFTAS